MTENDVWVKVSFNESILDRHLVLYWTFAWVGSLCACVLVHAGQLIRHLLPTYDDNKESDWSSANVSHTWPTINPKRKRGTERTKGSRDRLRHRCRGWPGCRGRDVESRLGDDCCLHSQDWQIERPPSSAKCQSGKLPIPRLKSQLPRCAEYTQKETRGHQTWQALKRLVFLVCVCVYLFENPS